jgi:hypothetical protein
MIQTKILMCYSDEPKLSAAFYYWKKLLPQLEGNPQLLQMAKKRWLMLCNKLMPLAYILDPKYQNEILIKAEDACSAARDYLT